MKEYKFVWFADLLNGNKIVSRKYVDNELFCCKAYTLKHALVKLLLSNFYYLTVGVDDTCHVCIGLYHIQYCDNKILDFNYTNKVIYSDEEFDLKKYFYC